MKLVLLFALVTVTAWACGDSDRPKVVGPGSAGASMVPRAGAPGGGSGGEGGAQPDQGGTGGGALPVTEGGEGGEGGEGEAEPLAPRVRITSPEASSSPDSGVLTEPEVEVTCVAEPNSLPGAEPVNRDSVSILLIDAEGTLIEEVDGIPTAEPNTYSAPFVIASLPSGRLAFRCSAADTARIPRTATDTIETFFDGGPLVRIAEPARNSVRPLLGAVRFEFGVEPVPLAANDAGSEIEAVLLRVRGVEIETTKTASGAYVAEVDLNDTNVFAVPPADSVPVEIRATNARGVERREDYSFYVDGKGPTIRIVSPTAGTVIGGPEELVFEVTDERSPVDLDSIVVVLNREEYRFDGSASWIDEEPTFRFSFDASQVQGSIAQLTVTVRARDEANNESPGGSVLYYVDNEGPIVSLDYPNIREIRRDGNQLRCSRPFDPLGSAAVNDLEITTEAVWFRALVYDRTNSVPYQDPVIYSLADPETVTLYLHQDFTKPFVVDKQGNDGRCDDVAPESRRLFKNLTPLEQTGAPPGGVPADGDPADVPEVPSGCLPFVEAQPEPVCQGESDLTRVIDHAVQGPGAVVYTVDPADQQSDLACDGRTWEVTDVVDEGWVCAAVVAQDRAGNRDVSAPLRFCLDDRVPPAPNCDPARAPRCTDGCEPIDGQIETSFDDREDPYPNVLTFFD